MDLTKILSELRSERDTLDEAIRAVELLALGGGKRRGRPPAWMAKAKAESEDGSAAEQSKAPAKKKAVAQ